MARDIYTPNTYNQLTQQAIEQGGMITFMYHSIYNDSIDDHWFGAISEDLLNAHLQAIKKNEDQVWITTFEKAIKYHKAKKVTTSKVTPADNGYNISITSTADTSKFNESLTFKITGIATDKNIVLKNKNNQKPIAFTTKDSCLLFNALPFNQELILTYQ